MDLKNNSDIKKEEKEISEEELKSKKKKSVIKYLLNISLVLIITSLAIYLTIKDDFSTIMDNIMTCDYMYLIVVIGIIIFSVLLRSLMLFLFARLFTRKYHFYQAMAVDQIGVFYNAVTPGATGGQPMQAYTYKKQGIPISSAVSILAMDSILFQITLIVYGIVSFAVKYETISQIDGIALNIGFGEFIVPIWPLTIIGFMLNLGVIGIVLMMGYWRAFHNFIMGPIITLLNKMHLIKKPDKTRESLRIQVENFKIEMRRLVSNIPFTILIVLLNVVYISVKYAVPYYVGKALGNQSNCATLWDSVFLSNYHQMMTGLIPIPGSAGVSELFFEKLFVSSDPTATTSFFFAVASNGKTAAENSKSLASTALLIWRMITFVIPLIIAGFVTAFYRASPHEEALGREKMPNRHTFIALQQETYLARKTEMETILETNRLTREAVLEKLRSIRKNEKENKKKKKAEQANKNSRNMKTDYDAVNIDTEDDSL